MSAPEHLITTPVYCYYKCVDCRRLAAPNGKSVDHHGHSYIIQILNNAKVSDMSMWFTSSRIAFPKLNRDHFLWTFDNSKDQQPQISGSPNH